MPFLDTRDSRRRFLHAVHAKSRLRALPALGPGSRVATGRGIVAPVDPFDDVHQPTATNVLTGYT